MSPRVHGEPSVDLFKETFSATSAVSPVRAEPTKAIAVKEEPESGGKLFAKVLAGLGVVAAAAAGAKTFLL